MAESRRTYPEPKPIIWNPAYALFTVCLGLGVLFLASQEMVGIAQVTRYPWQPWLGVLALEGIGLAATSQAVASGRPVLFRLTAGLVVAACLAISGFMNYLAASASATADMVALGSPTLTIAVSSIGWAIIEYAAGLIWAVTYDLGAQAVKKWDRNRQEFENAETERMRQAEQAERERLANAELAAQVKIKRAEIRAEAKIATAQVQEQAEPVTADQGKRLSMAERRAEIQRMRQAEPDVTITELAERLGFSTKTISKDIRNIEGN